MRVRCVHLLMVGFAAGLAVLGCDSQRYPVPVEESYPVRADWLVVSVPSGAGQPSRFHEPGFPPLEQLNRPWETLTGDDALLAAQARSRVILDTRSIETEVREELGKILEDEFGTPVHPITPAGPKLISSVKLDEKLAAARETAAEKRKEFAEARQKAATPADRQVVEILQKQVQTADVDLAALESRREALLNYEHELKLDAPTLQKGAGLYRNYCVQCHGLTGDGNGPGAKYLVPLPRDYRQGLFKFVTSDPSLEAKRKPLRTDLTRIIARGMDGSPMPQFAGLKTDEIEALASYVIHLSLRGEAEYAVMKVAANPNADELSRKDVADIVARQTAEAIGLWYESGRKPIRPDPNPYRTADEKLEAAARGHALFVSSEVGCTTCHTGYGRNAPYQFDSWGSIVRPRDLTVATLRGGRSPDAVYARILGGIPGSNMPHYAKLRPTEDEKSRGADKLWDLVEFVLHAGESEKRQLLKERFSIDIDP